MSIGAIAVSKTATTTVKLVKDDRIVMISLKRQLGVVKRPVRC